MRGTDIGTGTGDEKSEQVLRFAEAAKLLGVSRRTVTNYVTRGLLDLVYGCGKRAALGISMSSYNRFIHSRTKDHTARIAERKRRADAIGKNETLLRQPRTQDPQDQKSDRRNASRDEDAVVQSPQGHP